MFYGYGRCCRRLLRDRAEHRLRRDKSLQGYAHEELHEYESFYPLSDVVRRTRRFSFLKHSSSARKHSVETDHCYDPARQPTADVVGADGLCQSATGFSASLAGTHNLIFLFL